MQHCVVYVSVKVAALSLSVYVRVCASLGFRDVTIEAL